MLELETRLQCRLENEHTTALHLQDKQQSGFLKETNTNNFKLEEQLLAQRKNRLAQQMQDLITIRASYDIRDAKIELELAQLLNRQLLLEWRFYRANALKLNNERRQLDKKLRNVRLQLEALEAIIILPNNGSIDKKNN